MRFAKERASWRRGKCLAAFNITHHSAKLRHSLRSVSQPLCFASALKGSQNVALCLAPRRHYAKRMCAPGAARIASAPRREGKSHALKASVRAGSGAYCQRAKARKQRHGARSKSDKSNPASGQPLAARNSLACVLALARQHKAKAGKGNSARQVSAPCAARTASAPCANQKHEKAKARLASGASRLIGSHRTCQRTLSARLQGQALRVRFAQP